MQAQRITACPERGQSQLFRKSQIEIRFTVCHRIPVDAHGLDHGRGIDRAVRIPLLDVPGRDVSQADREREVLRGRLHAVHREKQACGGQNAIEIVHDRKPSLQTHRISVGKIRNSEFNVNYHVIRVSRALAPRETENHLHLCNRIRILRT